MEINLTISITDEEDWHEIHIVNGSGTSNSFDCDQKITSKDVCQCVQDFLRVYYGI